MSEPAEDSLSQPQIVFNLSVLGPFELTSTESGASIAVTAAKMRALLAYLATTPRGSEDRRRLAGMLWASRGENQARQNLRQMLSNSRRDNDARLLVIDDSRVGIDLSLVAIDRAALIDIAPDASADTLGRIADLYRGDFAVGLEIGEPDFDAWLEAERLKCREAAIALFDRLIRLLAEGGRHEEALRCANRLLEIDPLREETHRLVISEEAAVSGRASAMQRFESFRVLLRDELGVRPEAATMRRLDELRRPDAKDAAPAEAETLPPTDSAPPPATPAQEVSRPVRRALAAAAIMTVALLLGATATLLIRNHPDPPITYIDDNTGRASIAVLPFESDAGDASSKARAHPYEVETRLSVARQFRMTLIDLPDHLAVGDAAATGRSLRAQYVLRTRLTESPEGIVANVSLLDSATAISVATTPIPMTGPPFKFARQLYRYISPEMAAHRAKILSDRDPDSPAALSWRGAVAGVRTRVGSNDPTDGIDLFNRVLAREPDNFEAKMSLIGALHLRISRDQSTDRAGDLDRSNALLIQARQQRPTSAEVAFFEGMDSILRGRLEDAAPDFDRAVELDNTHWLAALKSAHVRMFLGHLEEADQRMEKMISNLLPDIAVPETAFIAGEIALSAGRTDRAVSYLEAAVRGNPAIARIHALYAAALWLAGRPADAHAEAMLSKTLNPPFPLERLAKRGGSGIGQRYREARDRQVAALLSAIAVTGNDSAAMSQGSEH
ncbi:BTAD domain-containing putative transcriptional regulator [Rhodopseudomonas sp.]|uniref:BTAD domain-containing putative transcriptional regulator n=1 Tax=Rhodopseudomonas sp. TaxID=1078 RepID=UPI0039E6FC14